MKTHSKPLTSISLNDENFKNWGRSNFSGQLYPTRLNERNSVFPRFVLSDFENSTLKSPESLNAIKLVNKDLFKPKKISVSHFKP